MSTTNQDYYVPEDSQWPIVGALALFTLFFGFALWVNSVQAGPIVSGVGFIMLAYLFYGWFSNIVEESLSSKYNSKVDTSFRLGMIWFIVSEVFFFIALFGSLFYVRAIALPWLDGDGHLGSSALLWPDFTTQWPLLSLPDASNYVPAKEAMGAFGIPLINTVILLTSGVTLTWAHHGLKHDNQKTLIIGLAMTVSLGVIFFGFQAYEYAHAYHEMDLTLESGIYGSTFYMLTGFHGFHVTMGTIMLFVILLRSLKGHFTADNHFAFEGVAWYWHFVDVVWLGLYLFVYWM
ncbi:MAG: cytochrome c oxidase subunit 3 [Gammaproteobacteria bacterium]|nr:cytochrome c oxidase subunit 3 [Gammaproteobacteria bacterium]